jgi:hypothetical protein
VQLLQAADIATVSKPTPEEPVLVRIVRNGAGTFIALTGEAGP